LNILDVGKFSTGTGELTKKSKQSTFIPLLGNGI
jgi:hypothetical protein